MEAVDHRRRTGAHRVDREHRADGRAFPTRHEISRADLADLLGAEAHEPDLGGGRLSCEPLRELEEAGEARGIVVGSGAFHRVEVGADDQDGTLSRRVSATDDGGHVRRNACLGCCPQLEPGSRLPALR